VASVSKTGRLIVVDEDYQSFGVSGEVIASVAERQPELLKHVARVCVPDVPLPYASQLEYAVLPTPARIEAAVREAVAS
jgi:pyruvate dehydrogenase E1 component beta subunit